MTLVLGIDEAGRGPVLGPLVLAGALIESERIDELTALGVDDSKRLTPARRRTLDHRLRKLLARFRILSFPPDQIDRHREQGELDLLEAQGAAELIAELQPDVAYVDGLGPGGRSHRRRIEQRLDGRRVRLVVENKADARYSVVGAASILAKVARDAAIEALAAEHGRIGSGYPGDPHTRAFLAALLEAGEPLPDFVRKSWSTLERLADRQGRLFE